MKKNYADGGMFREGMPVPQDIDGASVTPGPRKPAMKRPMPAKRPATRMAPSEPDAGGGAALPGKLEGRGVTPAFKKGGSVGSASRRADGIAKQGKTKGRMI